MTNEEMEKKAVQLCLKKWENNFAHYKGIENIIVTGKLENEHAIVFKFADSRYIDSLQTPDFFDGGFFLSGIGYKMNFYFDKMEGDFILIREDIKQPYFSEQEMEDFFYPIHNLEKLKKHLKNGGVLEKEHLDVIHRSIIPHDRNKLGWNPGSWYFILRPYTSIRNIYWTYDSDWSKYRIIKFRTQIDRANEMEPDFKDGLANDPLYFDKFAAKLDEIGLVHCIEGEDFIIERQIK